MPSVLVLGATGYLGLAISQALLRSGGYTVHGTARSAEKAQTLRKNEITPITDVDIVQPDALAALIAKNRYDIVIDASATYGPEPGNILNGVVLAAKQRAEIYAKENVVGPKLGFVYTSGMWIHGSPAETVSDLDVPGTSLHPAQPAVLVGGWRPAHEQAVLAARQDLDVAILRPGSIYGRGSWVFTDWWKPVLEASKTSSSVVKIPANANARAGIVHVDDVAAAYVAAANNVNGGLGSWPVFDLAAESVTIVEMVDVVKRVLGVDAATEFVGTGGNVFLDAQSTVFNSDVSRAGYVLGWQARRRGFVRDAKQIIQAWKESLES